MTATMKGADEALRSVFAFAYTKMITVLGDLILKMHNWAEACPCHSSALSPHTRCILKTRRGPELAAGDFDALMEELESLSTSQLALSLPPGLEYPERARVFQDFSLMLNRVVLTLRIKLASWKHFPKILASLGHPTTEVAREHAAIILSKWSSMTEV